MHFYMLFELKCVLAVCVHNHLIIIKIHKVFFFFKLNHFPFLISSHSQMHVCVTSHRSKPLPQLLIRSFYLRPTRSYLSSVCHCFDAEAGVDKKWLVSHLLLTSEPLKTQWITFVFFTECAPNSQRETCVSKNSSTWFKNTKRKTGNYIKERCPASIHVCVSMSVS